MQAVPLVLTSKKTSKDYQVCLVTLNVLESVYLNSNYKSSLDRLLGPDSVSNPSHRLCAAASKCTFLFK